MWVHNLEPHLLRPTDNEAERTEQHESLMLVANKGGAHFDLLKECNADDLLEWLSSALPGDKRQARERLAALYADEDGDSTAPCLQVRLHIGDVAFLHELRDAVLTGILEQSLSRTRLRSGDGSKVAVDVSIDRSQFAAAYESSVLSMDKLTPHQEEKMQECLDADYVHLQAPAGAGKTIVAMKRLLELLLARRDAHVLVVARNAALCYFVVRWVTRRMHNTLQRLAMLKRLDLLFEPFSKGPRAVLVERGHINMVPRNESSTRMYSLVLVDEAHHIYKDAELRDAVERHVPVGCRRMLLSDISQSTGREITYPPGVQHVVKLTEVVRSSQRIVAGAAAFQLGEMKETVTSHHNAAGPPLKTFLFDVDGEYFSVEYFGTYAKHTLLALQHVMTTFGALELHDRVAIVVPSDTFKRDFHPALETALFERWGRGRFKLVSAQEAAASALPGGSGRGAGGSWLVFDDVAAFDGLERLVVIPVGLDAPINESSGNDTLETRSRLYRALTRAHMLAVVVNEFLPGGFFEFLRNARLKDSSMVFDRKEEMEKRMKREHAADKLKNYAERRAKKEEEEREAKEAEEKDRQERFRRAREQSFQRKSAKKKREEHEKKKREEEEEAKKAEKQEAEKQELVNEEALQPSDEFAKKLENFQQDVAEGNSVADSEMMNVAVVSDIGWKNAQWEEDEADVWAQYDFKCAVSDVLEYAEYMGMDIKEDAHLLWIADEALQGPEPQGWEQRLDPKGGVYYFHQETGESLDQHPLDRHYQQFYLQMKAQYDAMYQGNNPTAAAAEIVQSVWDTSGMVTTKETRKAKFNPYNEVESVIEPAPEPKKKGLLGKLFGGKSGSKSSANTEEMWQLSVDLQRQTDGLGVGLTPDNIIVEVEPGGSVHVQGELTYGDQIVEVDGNALNGRMLKDVIVPKRVHQLVVRYSRMSTQPPSPRRVRSRKVELQSGSAPRRIEELEVVITREASTSGRLGFGLDAMNTVVEVDRHGPVAEKLRVGDKILAVDEKMLNYKKFVEVVGPEHTHKLRIARLTKKRSKDRGDGGDRGQASQESLPAAARPASMPALREIMLLKPTDEIKLGAVFHRSDDAFDKTFFNVEGSSVQPIVKKVDPGSIAENGGLVPGDVILSVNGISGLSNFQVTEMLRKGSGKFNLVVISGRQVQDHISSSRL